MIEELSDTVWSILIASAHYAPMLALAGLITLGLVRSRLRRVRLKRADRARRKLDELRKI